MDLPLIRSYDTTLQLLAWDIGIPNAALQKPIPNALFSISDVTQPEIPLQELIADGNGRVSATLDSRHEYHIRASHPNFLQKEKKHDALSFTDWDTARFDLIPLLPCSGSLQNEEVASFNTVTAYDMLEAPNAFCFRAGNDTKYDAIWITDELGKELYRLNPTANGGGLGVYGRNLIYDEVLVQSSSRFIYVHTAGQTNWKYEVACPGEVCRPGRHTDARLTTE
jgi:hypothetical protein